MAVRSRGRFGVRFDNELINKMNNFLSSARLINIKGERQKLMNGGWGTRLIFHTSRPHSSIVREKNTKKYLSW